MLTFLALQIDPPPEDPEGPIVSIVFDVISRHAQHFQGHIFQTRKREVSSFHIEAQFSRSVGIGSGWIFSSFACCAVRLRDSNGTGITTLATRSIGGMCACCPWP